MTLGWEVGAGGTCREHGQCFLRVMLVSMAALTTWLPQIESQTSVSCTHRVEPGGTQTRDTQLVQRSLGQGGARTHACTGPSVGRLSGLRCAVATWSLFSVFTK